MLDYLAPLLENLSVIADFSIDSQVRTSAWLDRTNFLDLPLHNIITNRKTRQQIINILYS